MTSNPSGDRESMEIRDRRHHCMQSSEMLGGGEGPQQAGFEGQVIAKHAFSRRGKTDMLFNIKRG